MAEAMPRVEKRVRELVSADPEMREAIQAVLTRAEEGEVQWIDVRDEITSGQWGRLIQEDVLVDGESGFALADREAIEAGLEDADDSSPTEAPDTDTEDDDGVEWSTYDKLAGAGTVGLFAGYWYQPVREVIGGAIDLVLGPLQAVLPFYAVIMILAVMTGLYSTLLRANLMDMDQMAAYQERMQEIQERRKEAKENDDEEALQEIQQEQMDAMGDQLGMFKAQFRPMVWIMFLTIPAFLWMYWKVGFRGSPGDPDATFSTVVLPLLGEAAWTDPVVGLFQVWILWYFLCSLAFTQIIQKALNIQMSPSTS